MQTTLIQEFTFVQISCCLTGTDLLPLPNISQLELGPERDGHRDWCAAMDSLNLRYS